MEAGLALGFNLEAKDVEAERRKNLNHPLAGFGLKECSFKLIYRDQNTI